ncbi:M48 metallopeptidase family protein [Alcaligenes faecalis]|uniref:M48 metallopeptidase family protein n=1 Tax=Alcaligenes faecalis TaxID=511 RepID=UPI000A3242D3|nr:M48 family metallopeptidase [Alcaligenes faecalis]
MAYIPSRLCASEEPGEIHLLTEGQLEFNWQITMAPNRMVDYVVIHELCHLLHHDHSPGFWKEVARVMPAYAQCRQWLKENGAGLKV